MRREDREREREKTQEEHWKHGSDQFRGLDVGEKGVSGQHLGNFTTCPSSGLGTTSCRAPSSLRHIISTGSIEWAVGGVNDDTVWRVEPGRTCRRTCLRCDGRLLLSHPFSVHDDGIRRRRTGVAGPRLYCILRSTESRDEYFAGCS